MSRLHRGRRNLRKLLEHYAAERGFTALTIRRAAARRHDGRSGWPGGVKR